ncbi:MAG: CMD domain protein [Caldilineaceae bacterium]
MPQSPTNSTTPDTLDQLVGIQPGSPLAELRARRPDVARYTQGSYDTLLTPADPAGVSVAERLLIALRVAVLTASAPLTAHYRQRLVDLGTPAATLEAVEHFPTGDELSPREVALLRHTDLLTNEPRAATQTALAELQAQGLSARDLVTIAQLIAFLSYQVRVLAGLQLLGEGL